MASLVNPSAAVWRKRVMAHAFAIVITGLTLQIRLLLTPWLGDEPTVILFMLPIILSAYAGGVGPGLVSTAFSAAGVYYFVLAKAPNIFFFEGSISLWQWTMLMVTGALVSLLIEALRRSRKRIESAGNLRSVTLASIGDAVITTDSEGRVTFLNGEAERLTQWGYAEAQGLPLTQIFRIINEETRDPVEDPVVRVLRTGTVAGLANHTVLVGRNGQETAIDDSGAPITESDGHIAGVVLVFRDCTESKKKQEDLARSVSLLQATIEASSDGMLVVDSGARVTVYNNRFLEMFKIPKELVAQGDDRPVLKHAAEQMADPGEFFRRVEEHYASPEKSSFDLLTLKDGRVIERVSHPQRLGERIVGRVWSFRDITERKRLEEELRAVGERMKFYMNRMPLGFIAWDRQFRVAEWNAAAEAMFGWKAQEAIGRHAFELIVSTEGQRQVSKIWEANNTTGLPSHSINENVTRDGRRIICEWRNTPWRDANGEICGLLSIASDITEAKLAEEKLAREQARFKLIFDTVPIGIAFHTMNPDGTATRIINDAHLHIAGLTRSQDIEPDIYRKITHPDDQALQDHFNNQIKAGQCKQFSIEKRYLHRDGKVVWVTFSYQREIYPDGTVVELTTVVDITERKAAEQRSRQLAVIVESSEDAIIGKDLNGIITTWNRGAETVFGYSAGETVGKSVLELYPPDLKDEEVGILARIGRGESIDHFQTERVRKDGKRIRISTTISPLRDSQGHVVGAAAIARDITRQQMLEEQLRQSQKMEAIGQLAGGVAHDFNNILAVIQMQLELSKMDGGLAPEQAGCLDEIQTAASRGANLTRQLLLFSRRQRLQPRELDLSDSITGMTKMLLRVLGEDIQIQFNYASQPLFIHADAGMMDQVLMNLTLNSRDAMPDGGQLTIETAAVEIDELAAAQSAQARPGSFVRLSVRDTGCGIAPEILPRIFEPFFTTKDVGKGTGLGLATVFSIVQQHQGWINVTSQPGRGTKFDLYFPRLTHSSLEPVEVVSLAAVVGGTETILLVEDDDALRAAVHRCLSQLGYRLIEAASGAAALKVWQEHRDEVQLLLTDLVMPGGVSGKDLAERLRQENPKLQVIYVSGYSSEVFSREFPLASDVTFLAKPFPAQELARAVRASLDKISI